MSSDDSCPVLVGRPEWVATALREAARQYDEAARDDDVDVDPADVRYLDVLADRLESGGGTRDRQPAGSARYCDPLGEPGASVGRGAVLYSRRQPQSRLCCAREGGRHLAHVAGVYEETSTGQVYYHVRDGTHTADTWIHSGDLLDLYEPAGWSVEGVKPTYLLTRHHGVEDHHDLMTDGGESVGDKSSGGTDRDKWDEQWVQICEMESGAEDPFPEFVSDVRAAMERAGNEVGRPLVMKVTVQVYDGELNQSLDADTAQSGGDR